MRKKTLQIPIILAIAGMMIALSAGVILGAALFSGERESKSFSQNAASKITSDSEEKEDAGPGPSESSSNPYAGLTPNEISLKKAALEDAITAYYRENLINELGAALDKYADGTALDQYVFMVNEGRICEINWYFVDADGIDITPWTSDMVESYDSYLAIRVLPYHGSDEKPPQAACTESAIRALKNIEPFQ